MAKVGHRRATDDANSVKPCPFSVVTCSLQPTTVLGNGLRLTDDTFARVNAPWQKMKAKQTRDEKTSQEKQHRSVHSPRSSPVSRDQRRDRGRVHTMIYFSPTRIPQAAPESNGQDLSTTWDLLQAKEMELAQKEAESNATVLNRKRDLLQAKEEELAQKEEILRWKRKAWLLEKRLAADTGMSGSKHRKTFSRVPREVGDYSEEDAESASGQYTDPDSFNDLVDDDSTPGSFDMDEPTPPASLAKLRTQMTLSTKGGRKPG